MVTQGIFLAEITLTFFLDNRFEINHSYYQVICKNHRLQSREKIYFLIPFLAGILKVFIAFFKVESWNNAHIL